MFELKDLKEMCIKKTEELGSNKDDAKLKEESGVLILLENLAIIINEILSNTKEVYISEKGTHLTFNANEVNLGLESNLALLEIIELLNIKANYRFENIENLKAILENEKN